ncbi:ferredoxin--NADP reductase [Aestuariibacter halophilus]|uniref:ferredoxin--NADP(+) reductase n=1 Tax=Fluctibacter halophilus TaxID=226011 RepID=A0ABS8GB61_9ALTE|nr:ferredoxin--NADP reductase [Aestuariibacter halophilus]MCC2617738.1 ferredoxin--NADP reductase [Aestuariibacter halophilus]
MAQWLDGTVVKRIGWNDHLFSLQIDCADFPAFTAGQFTKFGLRIDDTKVLSRPYSLVNAPQQPLLEILAVPVEEGQLSPQLHTLKEGDPLCVMAPATGFLVIDEVPDATTLWMMATGTGVGPFLSILADRTVWSRFENIVLVYGARTQADLAYMPLLQQWQQDYAGRFRFVPVVSREDNPGGLRGRIPGLIENGELEKVAGVTLAPANQHVMLCGNPDMITETVAVLEQRGMHKHLRRKPGHVSLERYW